VLDTDLERTGDDDPEARADALDTAVEHLVHQVEVGLFEGGLGIVGHGIA
jgi:hypothetical protein